VCRFADSDGGELVFVKVEVLTDGGYVVFGEMAEQPGDGFGDEDALFCAEGIDDLKGQVF
jgi:hypothetical protein